MRLALKVFIQNDGGLVFGFYLYCRQSEPKEPALMNPVKPVQGTSRFTARMST